MKSARISHVWMLCFAFALMGQIAHAQSAPSQFVVSGKAADKIQDFTTINLATAERIVEGCVEAVTAHGGGVHTIIVLDNDGNRVYMDRMDGQGYLNIITAEMKARTALATRQPSKASMNRVSRDPYDEPYEVQLGLYPVAGGLPIVVNNQMIGVVGAGGYRPNPPVWSDEICVHTALTKVIGSSVPPLIEDVEPAPNPNAGKAPTPKFAAAAPPKPSVPAEFVIPNKSAANVFDGDQISLATAKKLARACRDFAASKGDTATLYVLDSAGEMVHMERMDGETSLDNRTALMKAQTSLRLREPTSIRGTQLKNNPLAGVPRNIDAFNFYLIPGGIPIVVDGQMIGAV
ncbi:MAG TPA: heme-binding protein, partial [Candidatus Acidoferrales bacterium]|nr:heme-binding protein [Candidatus Acidoferrales bacterium]